MEPGYFAEWIRQAFSLALYSAGLGGLLGVSFVIVVWCALRPGKTTVVGTGLVALAVVATGAFAALHTGHSFLGGVTMFWGALFVWLSLRGAKTLEPAFVTRFCDARAAAGRRALCEPTLVAAADAGPYRSQRGIAEDTRLALRVTSSHAAHAWSRALVAGYACAVLAVLLAVRFAL